MESLRLAGRGRPPSDATERLIGVILVEAGRLRLEDAERILRAAREQRLRFGEAGLALGLLSAADVELALARQFDSSCLVRGESAVSEELVAAYASSGPQVEALRGLRSQLALRWFAAGPAHSALVVASAARGEGRSFVAANLAVVFAQLGERTLLVDADLRQPRQHVIFGLDNRSGFSAALTGRAWQESVQPIAGLPGLSVLPCGATPPNPPELLARPRCAQLMAELAQAYDVILLDAPSAADGGDALALVQRAGGALLVARRNTTGTRELRALADAARQVGATLVGTVLGDF